MTTKRFGAEVVLVSMCLPWVAWATIAIFDSKASSAVQDNKYENIMSVLKEIKLDIKELKSTHILDELKNINPKE